MNNIVYADTNMFLRYLTNEPPLLAEKVSEFFDKMESGLYKLYVCDIVVSELVYVLEKVFELSKREICEKIKTLMLKKNIIMENRQIAFKSLEIYRDFNINFVDAYIYSHSLKKKVSKVFSFDEHFKKFENMKVIP
ncbi:MAG: type II toxin-antitoxin system VapC family toxin [Actinobacteria bacterium]|nr:type II toxin-antitoxin system VapC family toxin [Actinomycetota bacterium]